MTKLRRDNEIAAWGGAVGAIVAMILIMHFWIATITPSACLLCLRNP